MADVSASVQEAVGRLEQLALGDSPAEQGTSSQSTQQQHIDWQSVSQLAKQCADSLKSEEARTRLGSGPAVQITSNLLQASINTTTSDVNVLAAQTQLCRVIGNLVLDHASNRQKCAECDLPRRILRVLEKLHSHGQALESMESLTAIKACTGALLNLCIQTPEIARDLYENGGLQAVGRSLQAYRIASWAEHTRLQTGPPDMTINAMVVEWSLGLIRELLSTEEANIAPAVLPLCQCISSFAMPSTNSEDLQGSAYPDIAHSLLSSDLMILSSASELLESHAYKSTELQESIAFAVDDASKRSHLQKLVDFVEHAAILPAWKPVIQSDITHAGDSLEAEKTLGNVKAEVARIVIAVCSNDKVMDACFKLDSPVHWLLERSQAWLTSSQPDLVITGSTMLANLARKDQYCVALVHEHSIAPILASILADYSLATPPAAVASLKPGVATQVLYGAVGLLKNLSIAGANKQTLCDLTIIEPCLSLLRPGLDVVVPIQNAAVGVLKHLCSGNIASSLRVLLPPTPAGATSVVSLSPISPSDSSASPLANVLALINRTNDVRLQCEATRLLVNVIRSLYSSRSISSPVTPSALDGLEMGIAKNKARAILENSAETVDAISEMIRTGEKYPILINEGIVALTLLSTTDSGASLALQSLARQYQSPAAAGDDAADSAQALQAPADQGNEYHRDRSISRAVSLNPKTAPVRSIDVLIKWLNGYAIGARNIPVEMAANALSLIEGVTRLPESRNSFPIGEICSCLEGAVKRDPDGPNEDLFRQVAQANLDRLRSQ